MKKILVLLFSIIMIVSFGITALAETSDNSSNTSSSESSSESSSSENSSSEDQNSSDQTPSEDNSSSEDVTSSENQNSSTNSSAAEPTLRIVSLPTKTVYEVGETLDVTGLKVNITTESGTIISNNGSNLNIASVTFTSAGEQRIEVKYGNVSAYFTVTVNAKHTHTFGAWTIEKEATCTEDGQKVRICECKYTETAAIAKLGHDWDEGEIVKKATTETEGQIKYVCTRCSEENVEAIPVLTGDTEDIGTETKEKFKLTLKWWMIFVPIALIIIGYITAISVIFKKKK